MKWLIVLTIIGLFIYTVPKGYVPAPSTPFEPEEWTYYEYSPGSPADYQYREAQRWLKRHERRWRREMRRKYRR